MKNVFINEYELIMCKEEGADIFFSTAKNELNFNKNTKVGLNNIENIKAWFNLKDVGYLNQIHSDLIHKYDGNVHDGDAIITDKLEIGIGVFTADCVPVIIYDKIKKVCAAVHSGWKGTIKNISSKTITRMIEEYNVSIKDLKIYIGPHNMKCCYEVSEDMIHEFKSLELYKNANITQGRNLSLQDCILNELYNLGISKNQITTLDICTFCNKKYNLYSYRKNENKNGRMFSFIFMK